jgi:hypothetical protein
LHKWLAGLFGHSPGLDKLVHRSTLLAYLSIRSRACRRDILTDHPPSKDAGQPIFRNLGMHPDLSNCRREPKNKFPKVKQRLCPSLLWTGGEGGCHASRGSLTLEAYHSSSIGARRRLRPIASHSRRQNCLSLGKMI